MDAMDLPVMSCLPGVTCPTSWNLVAMSFNVLVPVVFMLGSVLWASPVVKRSKTWLKDIKDLLVFHLHLGGSGQLSQDFWQEYSTLRQQFGEMAMLLVSSLHAMVTVLLTCQGLAGVSVYSRFWFAMWSAMGFVIMVIVRFPILHNWRGVPVSYILASLCLCTFILPVDGIGKQQIMLSNAPLMLGYVMIAPLGGLVWSSLAICFYSGVAIYSFGHAVGETDFEDTTYNWWQCTIGLFVTMVGSWCSILYVSNMVLQGVRRKAELAQHEAVFSLLGLVCDAVVEVDTNGAIMSQADRLYNILLMNSSAIASCSFRQGSKLQSFLFSDGDRQIFEDLMQRASATKHAEVRHMGMRDSMGSMVKMEVFLLSFAKGGSERYLMGIREHSDYERTTPTEGQDLCLPSKPSHELDQGDSSQAQACEVSSEYSGGSERSHRSRAEERYFEGMMMTSPRAIEVSLVTIMSSWKVASRGQAKTCCAFHKAALELKRASRRLQTKPCLRTFRQETGEQCPVCGIEDSTDPYTGECLMCHRISLLYPPLLEDRGTTRRGRIGNDTRRLELLEKEGKPQTDEECLDRRL